MFFLNQGGRREGGQTSGLVSLKSKPPFGLKESISYKVFIKLLKASNKVVAGNHVKLLGNPLISDSSG